MLEWLTYLELLSEHLAGPVLVIPGLVALPFGIALWLGGSLGRRGLVAVTAMLTGALLGFWLTGRSGVLVGGLGLAMAALVVPRISTGIMASLWIAMATVGFMVAAHPPEPGEAVSLGVLPSSDLTTVESCEVLLAHINRLGDVIWQATKEQSWGLRLVLSAVLVALTSIMALLSRLGLALYNAVVGTVLVSLGMAFLLLHKGSEPLLYAWTHYQMINAVWAGMILFGTTVQLLCCGRVQVVGGRFKRKTRRPDLVGANFD